MDKLRYGPLGKPTAHLCIDMQTLFAERMGWHLPWLERVLPELALHARGIRELVVTGAETDVCVLATVMAAIGACYRVVLASDALCSVSDRMHDALLQLFRERFTQQVEIAETDTTSAHWS